MKKAEQIAFASLATLIWVYLGLRSVYVPLIHDEAVTYFTYIQNANFIPPWSYWDANNHLLNSALSAFFHVVFGTSTFIIRLASWLSFLPLVFFVYKISDQLKSRISKWAFIIPLLTAPFFIEFFSLTRGYGMSMAWFLGVLYFAINYSIKPSKKSLVWISILGILTSLSSLSVIVSVFIIYGWVLLHQLLIQHKPFLNTATKWVGIFILPQAPLIYYVLLLKEKGLLYYGGPDFVQYTLEPFARFFFNDKGLWWIVIIPFLLIVFYTLIHLFKETWKNLFQSVSVFSFVLVISVFAVFAQHYLLGVNYPEDRAALYFFPLLIGAWASLPDLNTPYLKALLMVLVLWFPLDLVTSFNTTFSKLWKHEHVPYRFNQKVNSYSKDGFSPTIGTYLLRFHIWNYNQLDANEGTSTPNTIDHPSNWSDFVLVDSNRIKQLDLSAFDLLDYDLISGQTLLKRAQPNIEIPKKDTLIQDFEIKNLYTNIFEFDGGTWGNNGMAMYYDIDAQATSQLMNLFIISTLFDSTGQEIFSNKFQFIEAKEDWIQQPNQKVKLYLPPFPEDAGRFVTYVFNPENETHKFSRLNCSLAEISHP